MQWDSRMESGIPVIDFEHRQLVEKVNELVDEPSRQRIQEIFDFLREYVVKHFAHEQLMHKNCNYPFSGMHKQAHMDFVKTFLQLEEEYKEKGFNIQTLRNIIDTVNAWLREHILGMDMEFANYYKSLAPEERPNETSQHCSRPTERRELAED